jgi:hypothetical protein
MRRIMVHVSIVRALLPDVPASLIFVIPCRTFCHSLVVSYMSSTTIADRNLPAHIELSDRVDRSGGHVPRAQHGLIVLPFVLSAVAVATLAAVNILRREPVFQCIHISNKQLKEKTVNSRFLPYAVVIPSLPGADLERKLAKCHRPRDLFTLTGRLRKCHGATACGRGGGTSHRVFLGSFYLKGLYAPVLSLSTVRVDQEGLAKTLAAEAQSNPSGVKKLFQALKASTSPAPSHFGKFSAHLGFPCLHPRKLR